MKITDWDEILDFWNTTFGTKYTLHKKMLKAAYKKFPSLSILSLKLGTNPETLRLKLRAEGVKIRKQGECNKYGNKNWKKRKAVLAKQKI